jgi:hypothetical protein
MALIDQQVAELLASMKGRIDRGAPALCVGLMAIFEVVDRSDEYNEFNDFVSSLGRSTLLLAAHKRAHSDALAVLKTKKP